MDLTPWNKWLRTRGEFVDSDDDGPVLITAEYEVIPEREAEFIEAMRDYGRVRHRDGASRWGFCRDLEHPDLYLETFIVSSWVEHLRQHARLTRADSHLEERLRGCIRNPPVVRHLLYL